MRRLFSLIRKKFGPLKALGTEIIKSSDGLWSMKRHGRKERPLRRNRGLLHGLKKKMIEKGSRNFLGRGKKTRGLCENGMLLRLEKKTKGNRKKKKKKGPPTIRTQRRRVSLDLDAEGRQKNSQGGRKRRKPMPKRKRYIAGYQRG